MQHCWHEGCLFFGGDVIGLLFLRSIYSVSLFFFAFFLFLGDGLILDGYSQRTIKSKTQILVTGHSGILTPKLLNLV